MKSVWNKLDLFHKGSVFKIVVAKRSGCLINNLKGKSVSGELLLCSFEIRHRALNKDKLSTRAKNFMRIKNQAVDKVAPVMLS